MKNNVKYFNISEESYIQSFDGIKLHTIRNFTKENFDVKKPLLVFNYGLVCNHEHWKFQLPFFDQKGFQILIHDYRFHHKSAFNGNIEACTFKNIVKDLKLILSDYSPEKVVMLGHSMGVNVCLEYARSQQNNLKANILISGTTVPPQSIMFDSNITEIVSPYLKLIQEKYPKIFKSFWENSHKSKIVQEMVRRGGFNTENVPREFVEIYLKKMGELPHEIFLHLLEEMHNQDILTHLEDIKTPTLIIGGDNDKVIPNFLQFILSENLSDSELYIFKDGSHVPQVDFPEKTNERIFRFLSKKNLTN